LYDIQILLTFLQKYSFDVLLLGGIITIITGFVKRVLPEKLTNFKGYLPFLFGIVFYAVFSLFIKRELSVFDTVSRGLQSGGIATLIYAFYKHILKKKGDVKGAISDVLKGILSSKSITGVAHMISSIFKTPISNEEMLRKIEEILHENTELSTEVLSAVAKLIQNSLTDKK
jgi:prepilin signal peptidase PulO-like enzyme (type II secretory pathway)